VTGVVAADSFPAVSGSSSRAARALRLVAFLVAARVSADEPLAAPTPCPEEGDVIAVVTRKRELWLCQQGVAVAKLQVALGRGGVDKRRVGDGRTPLGTYAVRSPRASAQYGVFIPIDYPTREQAEQGFTGGELGIHGPPRGLTVPEYPTTAVDWTRGCIATGVDADIELIAEFVRTRQPTIVIR
jgi:murein L,D-transpeptidase YafK